jgi:DNA invertase Pin-like site-specific DNA recombinase
MRTAAYCRFSSDAQREASIRDQLRNVEAHCARVGWPLPALYQDQAISGSRNDRPGYRALLDAAEVGAFDVLLVDDLSRLSRDHIETAQTIRRLKFAGIRVVGVSDGTDTARDGYKLEAGIRGIMSEMYLDDLAKRTHRGLMGQALEGFSAGGLPYGYASVAVDGGFRREIKPDEARWVRYVFERYAAGASTRAIANDLNAMKIPSPRGGTWAHSAMYPDAKGVGMLGNAIYNGRQIWNKTAWVKDPVSGRRRRTMRPRSEWVIIESPELKIIDDDLWRACEARAKVVKRDTAGRREAGKNSGGRSAKYLFSGLLKCGVCGAPFTIRGSRYYGCSNYQNRGASVCANGVSVKKATIERVLLAGVKESLLSEEAFRAFEAEARALLKEARPDPGLARRKLATANKELDNLMSAIKAGIITPTTKAALQEAEGQVASATEELKAIERFEPTQMLPRAREIYRNMVAQLEEIDDVSAAREALRGLIGDVRLIPENGKLTAEIQSAGLAGALYETVVAGARSVRYVHPVIRLPLY